MRKLILPVAMFFAVACHSPESRVESNVDSSGNSSKTNRVTNSAPGGASDTGAATGSDTLHRTDMPGKNDKKKDSIRK